MRFQLVLILSAFVFMPACDGLNEATSAVVSYLPQGKRVEAGEQVDNIQSGSKVIHHPNQAEVPEHNQHAEHSGHGEHQHRIVATTAIARDVANAQPYVCQIHSCRHIEVKALESGYLEPISVREGQLVQQSEVLFKIVPSLFQARLDADLAEAKLVQIEYDNAKRLFEQRVVSAQEVALAEAKLAKAQAHVKLAQAELNFTQIKAPFQGIIDRLHFQQGSLVAEGDVLTTLSDNSVMWVYFNVPEARYLEYKENLERHKEELTVELVLANHNKFPIAGKIGAIEADFNSETGNIAFRADFANPDGLLRHGQTGNILVSRTLKNAVVVPQRATFEILAKRYVYVIDEAGVVHQREIIIQAVQDDIFVLASGLAEGEKIVLEGIRQVRDAEHVEADFVDAHQVLSQLKNKAE